MSIRNLRAGTMNRMRTRSLPLLLSLLCYEGVARGSSVIPGAEQERPIALVGATIYPVTSERIENGTLLIEQGRIRGLGASLDIPENAQVVRLEGKSIYPGFINSDGLLGLIEVNSVRATRDYAETGEMNPNVRAEVALNPDSELLPVTRSGGVLLSLATPRGGLISGSSALIQLDGWTWEDLTVKAPVGVHVSWPRTEWRSRENGSENEKDRASEQVEQLRDFFEDARAYLDARAVLEDAAKDLKFEAIAPVLNREIPLIVAAESLSQIQSAVSFAVEQSVRLIIYGGYDAGAAAPLLAEHEVPVIIAGVHRLPRRRADPYDLPFTLPNRLRLAGVQYCIAANDSFNAPNTRNLPFQAAHAVAFGLPETEALKAITIYPARILGLADRVGSLEVGKDATLFVADGNPLETRSQIEGAYVQGRLIDLSDRHKTLWKKYRERLLRLKQSSNE